MANLTTLVSGSSVTLTVTEGQTIVLNNGRSDVARLTIATGIGAGRVVTASHNGRNVYGPFSAGTITLAAVSGNVRYELSGDLTSPLDDDQQPLSASENGSVRALVTGGRSLILDSQSAGADSGWLPLAPFSERFMYQLTSGSTSTTFQMDISADGVTSLGTAYTGVWADSTKVYITQAIPISNPLAKFFRWTILTGGPLSLARYA